MLRAQRALLSVSDKNGLVEFARGLSELGIEIVSTGGTHRVLAEAGVEARKVAEITGSPEILGGRVKSLHPSIHGGILADRSKTEHLEELEAHGIGRIDLVVVNLYPFRETVAAEGVSEAEAVEQIDIGGPGMTRAAAKNFAGVGVVVDPGDYGEVLAALRAGEGALPAELRRRLAVKAFRHTRDYDAAIVDWLEGVPTGGGDSAPAADSAPAGDAGGLPARKTVELERVLVPRYGENPHQQSAVYALSGGHGVFRGMRTLQGRELSWNNVLDADAARKLVWLFDEPAVVIVKHNNPCGVGRGSSLKQAYERALACDPVSAFGSIVTMNGPADGALAEAMRELFVEVVVAPGYDEEALEIFGRKKNLRLIEAPAYLMDPGDVELRSIDGGVLAQTPDGAPLDASGWECATERQPTDAERSALEFVWRVTRYVKSNAIVLAGENQTIGVGAGQMSRVDSCRLAISKAVLAVKGSVAGSDAFFPFRDGVDVLAEAGVTAIVQPGGSRRDDEIVAACDEHRMAMLFTGRRHFRH